MLNLNLLTKDYRLHFGPCLLLLLLTLVTVVILILLILQTTVTLVTHTMLMSLVSLVTLATSAAGCHIILSDKAEVRGLAKPLPGTTVFSWFAYCVCS